MGGPYAVDGFCLREEVQFKQCFYRKCPKKRYLKFRFKSLRFLLWSFVSVGVAKSGDRNLDGFHLWDSWANILWNQAKALIQSLAWIRGFLRQTHTIRLQMCQVNIGNIYHNIRTIAIYTVQGILSRASTAACLAKRKQRFPSVLLSKVLLEGATTPEMPEKWCWRDAS